jgi:hypothetical protein
MFQLTPF